MRPIALHGCLFPLDFVAPPVLFAGKHMHGLFTLECDLELSAWVGPSICVGLLLTALSFCGLWHGSFSLLANPSMESSSWPELLALIGPSLCWACCS